MSKNYRSSDATHKTYTKAANLTAHNSNIASNGIHAILVPLCILEIRRLIIDHSKLVEA